MIVILLSRPSLSSIAERMTRTSIVSGSAFHSSGGIHGDGFLPLVHWTTKSPQDLRETRRRASILRLHRPMKSTFLDWREAIVGIQLGQHPRREGQFAVPLASLGQ